MTRSARSDASHRKASSDRCRGIRQNPLRHDQQAHRDPPGSSLGTVTDPMSWRIVAGGSADWRIANRRARLLQRHALKSAGCCYTEV